jgi:hypothetical protein
MTPFQKPEDSISPPFARVASFTAAVPLALFFPLVFFNLRSQKFNPNRGA